MKHMKTRLLTTTFAVVALFGSQTARAVSSGPKSQQEMTEICKQMGPDSCRQMMREMVKRKDLCRPMAEELMQSSNFEQTWQELHKHQSAHGG